jgi:hypothetical protein
MANQDLFMFDHCYAKPDTLAEVSFNAMLRTSYDKHLATSVRDCEMKALQNNSEFFLINDISNGINNTKYTNCYLPKQDNIRPTAIGDNSIIERAFNLFNSTFSPAKKQPEAIDVCNNLLYNSGANNPDRCFKYLIDDKVYAPQKYYAFYKKPIINESNRNITLQDPRIYRNAIASIKTYEELLKIDDAAFINNGPLAAAFKDYICRPSVSNEVHLDGQIIKLKEKYEILFNQLDAISIDISSLNYLNSFDDETIIALNVRISNRTKELNNLLSYGGANNGRLDDTTFLTQFKIVENSILLLIIITAVFFYTKMKKK